MIRRAEVEDGREFNALVNSLGGQALFRALFGQYNFTSLVEYSHLSLIAINEEESCVCFAAFSDGAAGTTDIVQFDELLIHLSTIIPCRVSFHVYHFHVMVVDIKHSASKLLGTE